MLRRVADRYLPKHLSRRRKLGFRVSAFGRMQIQRDYFKNAFVADYFKLSGREFDHLFETGGQALKIRLLTLEAWCQIFIEGVARSEVREQLKRHVFFERPAA